jgi:hypothetical protein
MRLFIVGNIFCEALHYDIASWQKGYLSLTIYNEGDKWGDAGVFETQEDLDDFLEAAYANTNPIAEAYHAFGDPNSGFTLSDEDLFKMPVVKEWHVQQPNESKG